ncbi:cell wall / vacuolar inhibitor of fructosidase 2 [Phtheirospermum japonicum]|uniref:Cell wall / vacuolar inhibitor of fructosidase 2 n=1 Tax=Phtheirospermum japonicum TaxID=374723 RepID=A0A830D8S8_9LAMI|nr:cell wall / vacuolar inhibitor of fructosidase 2 [Phtheirospermum japonicum]
MAAILSNFLLLITLTVLCFFLPPSAAADKKTPLAIEVCKNTTDFNFCRQSIYSDPRAATADRVILAYISFTNAYLNATYTRDYIASLIKSAGVGENHDDVVRGLKSCLGNYDEVVRAISEVLRDLDDETYYEFDKLSLDAENNSRACERALHGRSPITQRNVISIKLANICYVVSKLFQYND